MNEFLRNFIMTGIRDMINNDVALYQTYQYASGWFAKGILLQEDLEEIQRLYEEKETPEEETEEIPEGEDANIEENVSYNEQDTEVQPTDANTAETEA